MRQALANLSNALIFALILSASFLTPLFFLPTTAEFFDFNKFTLIMAFTVVSLILWSIKVLSEGRVTFTRTPLNLPLILLLVAFVISTATSLDRFVSIVGAHGRPWPSAFALLVLALFYFLTTSTIKNKKQVDMIVATFVASVTLASVISLISYFGYFLPFDFAQIRSFNPAGIVTRLAIIQAATIPITLLWATFAKNNIAKLVGTFAAIIIFISLVLISFKAAFITLGLTLVFVFVAYLKEKVEKQALINLAFLAAFALLILVVRFVPPIANGTLGSWIRQPKDNQPLAQIDTPKEQVLPQKSGWDIAAQTIGKRPITGTGPATFSFAYTQLKPRYLNSTDLWTARFDKSSSDFTEMVTTTGVLGILAFLLVLATAAKMAINLALTSKRATIYIPLAASIVALIIASFLTVSSFTTAFALFLLLALLASLAKVSDEDNVYDLSLEVTTQKKKTSWFPLGNNLGVIRTTDVKSQSKESQIPALPAIFAILVIIGSSVAIWYQIRAYRGEYFFHQATLSARTNEGARTIDFLDRAIRANPRIDTYHRVLSATALSAALNLSGQKDLNDDQKRLLAQLAQVSVDQAKIASGYQILPVRLPGISAANVANWETLANTYQALLGSAQDVANHAVNSLAQAVNLDPENPLLHDRLGLLYQRINDTDRAKRKFEDATVVKADFGPARWHLAKLLIDNNGDVARIVNELILAKRFLPKEDPAIAEIDKHLETYNAKLRDLQQKGQLEATPSAKTASPTPSPSPSPKPTASPEISEF